MALLSWLTSKFRNPKQPVTLICMPLDKMVVKHPDQITGKCAKCGIEIGIYPDGQKVLKEHKLCVTTCLYCERSEDFDYLLSAS